MNHLASPSFWKHYADLPPGVRKSADKNFELLKQDPKHPGLHFKRIGRFWSARVGISYRALAVETDADLVWFWIGDHSSYERLISS